MSPGQLAADSIGAVPTELMLIIVALLSLAAFKLAFVWITKAMFDSNDAPGGGNRTFDWWYSSGGFEQYAAGRDQNATAKSISRQMRKRS